MGLRKWSVCLLLLVFLLAGMQVWGLVNRGTSGVLSAVTTMTLEERVRSLESRVAVLEKNTGTGVSASRKATESYMTLSGGEISSFGWSKISGTDFTLDTSLYGKNVEVAWQGWLEGGAGAVRLFDSTNHRAVDFSEYSTGSDGKKSFYTKVMSIWRGQNQYYIEGKTIGGTMILSAPRLKIVAK